MDEVERGFIAALEPGVIRSADGRTVFDVEAYGFLSGDCPPTANERLWRQGGLCAKQGLFRVTEGVYQVRGLDLSNMTLIEGKSGVIVVDPLVSTETAAAALGLYRDHRGHRPVTAIIYTHPHIDHFGGVLGVVSPDDVDSGRVPVVAPEHFMEHAVSENVYAGTAMIRRGMFFGAFAVERGPEGRIGLGLGIETSSGQVGLIPPTLTITGTGQRQVLDGVTFVFQMTPGTEAPAEMNFFLPDSAALCMAENACHTLHNLLTLRGAQVRDARMWSRYINEAIELFVDDTDVVFASHHWPTWGRADIRTFLTQQRDMYAYLHDQTLRMMNAGATGIEIAEEFQLPPALANADHVGGFYGSVSHDVKAVYQRYMGWYDGNPAHLWPHPPKAQGERYAKAFGGVEKLILTARGFAEDGDLRFAAELASHAVFAAPDDTVARELLASILTRLGHGSECATWRNNYLEGAHELREGIQPTAIALASSLAPALSVTQIFDSIAIRVNGPRAWNESLSIDWHLTDTGENYRVLLSNGALIHYAGPKGDAADMSLVLTRRELLGLLAGKGPGSAKVKGDSEVLQRLMAVLDQPQPDFAIVTP